MEDEKEDKQETPATVTLTKEQFEALVGKKKKKGKHSGRSHQAS